MSGQTAWAWLGKLLKGLALAATALTQWLPGAALASVTALTAALWLWAGTDGSMRQALAVAAPLVPEIDDLTWTGLEATLRDGGQAEQLVWQQNGLTVVVSQPRFSWQFLPLLMGQPLALEWHASAVRVVDQRPADTEPFVPPDNLDLPVAVAMDFDLGPVFWANHPTRTPTPLTQRLRGRYTYAENDNGDEEHRVRLTDIRAALGSYQGDVRVLSAAPLTLAAQISGTVTSPPHATTPGWQATTQLRVTGELHGPQATLAVAAQVDSPSNGPKADLQAQLQPWQNQPLRQLHTQLHRLDLATFWTELPHTLLTGNARVEPTGGQTPRWTVSADLANGISGTWDNGRLPVASLALQAHGNVAAGQLTRLNAHTGGGLVTGSGSWLGTVWQGKVQAQGLRLTEMDSRLPPALLQGTLQAKQRITGGKRPSTTTEATLEAVAAATPTGKFFNSKQIISIKRQAAIYSKIRWDGKHLGMHPLKLTLDTATLQADGELMPHTRNWDGNLQVNAPGLQASSQGQWGADAGNGQLSLNVDDGAAAARWVASLPVIGSLLGARSGQPAPAGQGQATLKWDGGWRTPTLHLDAKALLHKLAIPATTSNPAWGAQGLALALAGTASQWSASANGQMHRAELGAQLNLALNGQTPGLAIGRMGHASTLPATRQIAVSHLTLALGPRRGPAVVRITNPLPLSMDWRTGHIHLAAGALHLHTLGTPPSPQATSLGWDSSTWGRDGLSTTGRFSGVGVHPWARALVTLGVPTAHQALKSAGVGGDLTLQGQWQLNLPNAQPPQGRLLIAQQSGDLTVDETSLPPTGAGVATALPLGLTQASVEMTARGEDLHLQTQWNSARAGQVSAQWVTRLTASVPQTETWGWLPQRSAALTGRVQATVPDIGVWSRLAPPGWRVRGQLGLDASVGGTLGQPDWQGTLNGDALQLQSVVEGLVFANGTLRATLRGDGMDITRFKLEGEGGETSGGSLQLTGHARWPAGTATGTPPPSPSLSLQATAQRLRVSARADRRLTLSGQANAQIEAGLLTLRGQFRADQAQFVLPDETTPSLGQDVVVRLKRAAPANPNQVPLRTDLALQIDLGPQFEVRGQGLQTRLGGELTVTSPPRSDTFQVVGEVRAINGTYRAYGQPLRIEDGVLRFSGPYDDPALEVLALRGKGTPGNNARNLTGNTFDNQQVGVQITGSARTPRVALYANPDLPDSEKLAWLVLGRPTSGAGAETAVLQQAALALLSGQNGRGMDAGLATALGLDDIGLRGDTAQRSDGSVGQTTAITLGKRLSNNLYVAYEQSLNTALGAVNVFYDVSRHLTVRAQAGHESALDLIFTLQRD